MKKAGTAGISAEQALISCCMGSWPSISMAWLKTSASVCGVRVVISIT